MDVLTSKTCWALNNGIKKASDIKLVSLYSTIKMMHGPINIRFTKCCVLILSTTFVRNISHSTYNSASYCQKWTHVYLCTAQLNINLYAPCILYIGQTYRSSPQCAFYIFSQQIYLIIFLDFLSPPSFIPPQNVLYFLILPFLVHKIFTYYVNGVLNCKYPAPGPKG